MVVPSRLLGVVPLLRLIRALLEKPLVSTVPVLRGNRTALRVLRGICFRCIPKPSDQEQQDPLKVSGVVNEPF